MNVRFRAFRFLVALAATVVSAGSAPAVARPPGLLVDPFVGTLADFGQLSPAAVAPYGMVQIGPDTDPANHAGYDHAATRLVGFSHTRGVGVGCGGAGGDVRINVGYGGDPLAAPIDKRRERAHAGYYRVAYGRGIIAEMTATRGTGAIRFTMPRSGPVTVSVDFGPGYAKRIAAKWQAKADGDLHADFSAGTVCDAGIYHLHSATRLLRAGKPVTAHWQGDGSRATLMLTVRSGDVVELRTGLSAVDAAAAAAVRETEMGDMSFDHVAARALADWNTQLSRLTISGSRAEQALFYTALFRVMQTPVAITDPDGRTRGSDGRILQLDPGEQHYASWAMWDNYRTQMPLLALIDPVRAEAIARALVRLYASGKQRWATSDEPFLTVRTEHAGIALLDFRRKGIIGFDAKAALSGMVAESSTLARNTPDEQIEAAYDDWATAELAADLGEPDLARSFHDKALGYRPMWLDTFRDLGPDADVVKARGLYQGTLAQYRWAPVFDLPWLAQAMEPRLIPELERFFGDNLFNITNQPDLHVPYLLAWAGRRDASLAIVRRYLSLPVAHRYTNSGVRPEPWIGRSFALAPQGFADGMDDDAGTMSAWYIWATLGLYPLTPGEPRYLVTKPIPKVTVLRPFHDVDIVLRKGRDGLLTIGGQEVTGIFVEHTMLDGIAAAKTAQK
ncbi:glycoside hydrolase domain-containing protein [Polymorphobacter fuscus]|uniref:Glycosyl hydrolase family 92 n=1 Tax=Sandarakinorhabdus fusca TaxID=1439888 RepID=A0A7C9KZM0_9SPHN|nr:glycoside hydrolase domain-containing protein [Polymorphobacter fuscus]KAB7644885.1 glycoside hydrolase family 92 protein [Polymorphobacter fuscus]MQT18168.1 glycosyl hydrolase family 92 [Polymorphobacter fuscus]NJC09487.1 putative alpha-1,2-mannosidase [Polymorphobacter fuscus]